MRTTGDRVDTTSRYTLRTWVGLLVLCLGAAGTLLNMAILSPLLRSIGRSSAPRMRRPGNWRRLARSLASRPRWWPHHGWTVGAGAPGFAWKAP
jgi:hypothetical protein